MKYYAAVLSKDEMVAPLTCPPYCILGSYWYFKTNAQRTALKAAVVSGHDVFVDSGAFSAENSGRHIDIDEYCAFVKDIGSGTYAALDVIGDPVKTWSNLKHMEERHGLNPIPTFHLGSDIKYLHEMMHYPYIALGGLVFSKNIDRYCDEIWGIILKERPDLRVHGFGLTNFDLMERYPWYSVDSSSYKGGRRFGRIQILWNGFTFKTFNEDEFQAYLKTIGYNLDNLQNKDKWFMYDFHSVQSYKLYAEHLKEVNKTKDFSYLTSQMKMF